MTQMMFQEWNPIELKWNTFMVKSYSTFTEALKASNKIWDEELLPLQRKGREFHCVFNTNI